MKIEKKKGVDKIRIVGHNRVLFWIIIGLIVLLAIVIYGIVKIDNSSSSSGGIVVVRNFTVECRTNSDCIASTCCHANSCVPKNLAPKCDRIMCTQECKPGTLDCQQGSCGCVKGKCIVSWKS
jgi:hypothetical protein